MTRPLAALALLMIAAPALAQEAATVASLLAQGFEVRGVMPSNAGPGILLQKGADLEMCFVAETPGSTAIDTAYCKPVR